MKTLPRKTSAHNETVAPPMSTEMTSLSTTTVNKRFRLLVYEQHSGSSLSLFYMPTQLVSQRYTQFYLPYLKHKKEPIIKIK